MKRICTLLGPEGPEHESPLVGRGLFLWTFFGQQSSFRKRAAGRKGYRPYFENYTVDASILNLTVFGQQITKINTLTSV